MEINNYDSIADLYDIYVPVTFDLDFFLYETRRVPGEVLELMSGTGRVSIPLIEAGVKLTCVDISSKSNAILENKLHRKGSKAEIHTMDICGLDLGKMFEMVIIPFHSFAHITSQRSQREVLHRIYQHLQPGGTFILTLGNPAIRQQAVNGQLRLLRKYPLANHGILHLWVIENNNEDDEQIVEATQFYEEYDSNGVLTTKRVLEIHFRLSRKEEIEALANEAGFKIKAFYGDYSRSIFDSQNSPFMIWLFEKPIDE